MADIHATLEMVTTLDDLAKALKAAKADGNVNFLDIPKFAKTIADGRQALKDAPEMKAELADLDGAEIETLVNRLFGAATALAEAVLTPSA